MTESSNTSDTAQPDIEGLARRIETTPVDGKFGTRLFAMSDAERDLVVRLLRSHWDHTAEYTSDTGQLGSEPVAEMAELADLIESGDGLMLMRPCKETPLPLQLGIKRTAIIIAALRSAALASQQGGEKAEASAQEAVAYQFRQRSAVGKGPQSQLPWCDWVCIEREDYERYMREPNKLVQVRPLFAGSRIPAAIAPAVWNDGYQAEAMKLAATIQSQRHKDFTPEYQEKLLLADALMQALGVVERQKAGLDLAVCLLAPLEPGDSRAVSDQFVALAALSTGDSSPAVMTVIRDSLQNSSTLQTPGAK